MSQIAWKSPLEKMQTAFALCLQIVMAFVLGIAQGHQSQRPTKKRYVVKARPMPIRVRDSVQILELTQILGDAEAALVVWTLRGWLATNKASNRNLREGHHWTYNPLPEWCEKHFQWMTVDQLSYLMKKLTKSGVVIRKQFYSPRGKCYWYRLNETVLGSTISPDTTARKSPAQSLKSPDQTRKAPDQTRKSPAHTTKESSTEVSSIPDSRPLTTATALQGNDENTDAAVVDPQSRPDPESESGEHSLNGEGHDTTAVKAYLPHEQHHDDQPLPKVPPKGVPALVAELVAFGVLPPTAQRLVEQYPEADVRYVMRHAQSPAGKNLFNPPGFLVDELDTGKHGVLAARAMAGPTGRSLSAAIASEGPVEIEAWRLEALRRENDRFAAEEAEALRAEDCEVMA